MRDRALVLFSGGQDSTTCLAWALANFNRVETVGFRYGQRHAVEMDCRPKILAGLHARFPAWGKKLGEDHVLDLEVVRSLGATAMTHDIAIRMTESGLPNTFVPGRNLGMDTRFTLETPLMWIDKAATFSMAEELGGEPLLDLIAVHTHTCYLGNREPHEWGPGCGECPACKLRKDGYGRYRAARAASEKDLYRKAL